MRVVLALVRIEVPWEDNGKKANTKTKRIGTNKSKIKDFLKVKERTKVLILVMNGIIEIKLVQEARILVN